MRTLLCIIVAGGFLYGSCMGSFSWVQQYWGHAAVDPNIRWLQAVYSGFKVPILVVVSTSICLPNFIVFNTLLGLGEDLKMAIRAILTAQGCVAISLASLAPLTLTLYVSTSHYPTASVMNGTMFLMATLAGQLMLWREYRPLIAKNRRHAKVLVGWLTLYVFVGIQLAWMLRPFIGAPMIAVDFLRAEQWGSCYVKLGEAVSRFVSGH